MSQRRRVVVTGLGAVTPVSLSVSGLVSVEVGLDGQLQPVVVPLLSGSLSVTSSLAGVLGVPSADVADLTARVSVEVVLTGDLHDPGLIAPCSRTLYIDAVSRLSVVRPRPRVRDVAPALRTSRVRGGCCG